MTLLMVFMLFKRALDYRISLVTDKTKYMFTAQSKRLENRNASTNIKKAKHNTLPEVCFAEMTKI